MWELDHKESWTPRNWCFWTMVWRRLLRVPWTARRSSQSILKLISSEYSWKDWWWSWNSSTLATWWEVNHRKRPWCWEILRAGGEGDDRGWNGWMASPTQWTSVWASSGSWWWTGKPGMLNPWRHKELDMTEGLNWLNFSFKLFNYGLSSFNVRVPWWRICLPIQEMQETWVWSLGGEYTLDRKWQPPPVFLPGKSHGQKSLTDYNA